MPRTGKRYLSLTSPTGSAFDKNVKDRTYTAPNGVRGGGVGDEATDGVLTVMGAW